MLLVEASIMAANPSGLFELSEWCRRESAIDPTAARA
jgi:hypothetical protein